jgi:hypothetical protein
LRKLAPLLAVPILLAAAPQPQGTLTLTSTTPVTFTAETSNLRNGSHLWVSLHCYPASGDVYYGEELADANGNYVMDDQVWVLWSGTVAEGQCRAFLIYRFDSQSGKTSTGEVILYDTGWFQAP